MEEFKKYYKFPLKMIYGLPSKVFTDDNNMAFDWLAKTTEDTKGKILAKINSKDVKFNPNTSFRHSEGIIYVKTKDSTEHRVCRIRGWGMLTGVGGYNLPADKAAEIQDAFAKYCVEMLNK